MKYKILKNNREYEPKMTESDFVDNNLDIFRERYLEDRPMDREPEQGKVLQRVYDFQNEYIREVMNTLYNQFLDDNI